MKMIVVIMTVMMVHAYVADDMVMLFLRSGEDGDDEDGGGR